MTKEDVEKRVMHFNLEALICGGKKTNLVNQAFRPKNILAMVKPEWPKFLQLATHKFNIDLEQGKFSAKDMELLAYAIGENPMGACGIQRLNLR